MTTLATAAQMRELDRVAIEERGIPSLELMENAARAATEELIRLVQKDRKGKGAIGLIVARKYGLEGPTPEQQAELDAMRTILENPREERRIAVFCGPGNNGGDGVAAARLLMEAGFTVRAFLVGKREHMTPDCRAMEEQLMAAGGKLEDFNPEDELARIWVASSEGIMDALFGVGLSREVTGDFRTAIEWINRFGFRRCPVVACDIPSGLHADTGNVMGTAVKATATVTFSHAKPGLYLNEGRAYSGKVHVAPIGIPDELSDAMIRQQPETVTVIPEYARYVLPIRPRTAHKGDFGKVFILAGSEGFTGAPVLSASAAVRSGAGLVFLGVPREIYPIAAVKCDEAMPFPLGDYEAILEKARGCDVALIGPGLGRAPQTERLVHRLLGDLEIPVVLDADGINALSGHIDILDKRKAPTVLPPHDGEFQRLTGCSLPMENRLEAARDFARAHGCVLVLKGHCTITAAPDGKAILNPTGNPGMAKGGCGDVLAGMLAGFLGQKHLDSPHMTLAERVASVVFYHGKVGDHCAGKLGEYGMTPTDMIAALPEFLKTQEDQLR